MRIAIMIVIFAAALYSESVDCFIADEGTTVWDADTIVFYGDEVLGEDDTLTIKEGVVIISRMDFMDDPLTIEGVLNIQGTAERPVIFEFSPYSSASGDDTSGAAFLLTGSAKAYLVNTVVRKQRPVDQMFDLGDSSGVEVRDCSFSDNVGVLFNLEGKNSIAIHTSTFSDNDGIKGLVVFGNSAGVAITVDSSDFTGNEWGIIRGSGLSVKCTCSLSNCTFEQNIGNGNAGVLDIGAGGAISVAGCRFLENRTTRTGGVLYVSGSSLTVSIADSYFEKNKALDAMGVSGNCGAFMIGAGAVSIRNVSFIENSAGHGNACGYISADNVSIIQTVFFRNFAVKQTDLFAGALFINSPASLLMANCTIVNNRSSVAGGLYLCTVQAGNNRIVNTVIAGNTGEYGSQVFIEKNNNTVFTNCFISSGSQNVYLYNATEKSQNFKNIRTSGTLFSDSAAGDLCLAPSSPCVNGGAADTTGLMLPENDLSGKVKRIVGTAIDIGAYEYPTENAIISRPDRIRPYAVFGSSPENVQVYTLDGKIVGTVAAATGRGSSAAIQPVSAGFYLVRETAADGPKTVRKVVRY